MSLADNTENARPNDANNIQLFMLCLDVYSI